MFFVLLYKRRVLQNELEVKAVEARHQKEMLSATLQSQEEERNRLGSELHDSVGAMLSSIKLNLQITKKSENTENLDPILGHLDETITQVRNISHQMMPIILKKYGLKRAIEDLFEKVSNENIKAELGPWMDVSLEKDKCMMLYRVIQELTNNSLKHSGGSHIVLESKQKNSGQLISFYDNGKGFPKDVLASSDGMGMLNIKNRAQAIKASVHFSNRDEGGAKVDLVLAGSM